MTPAGSINAAAHNKPRYLRIHGPLRLRSELCHLLPPGNGAWQGSRC
jgi:hypothetical protein